MLIEQEDHWILTVLGYGAEHHPPTDEQGYLDFIASVAPPDVLAAIRDAEPLSELVTPRLSRQPAPPLRTPQALPGWAARGR